MLNGKECICPAAKEKREIEKQITNAKQAIQIVFVNSFDGETVAPPSDEAIKLMEKCVEEIAYNNIAKVSIVLPDGIKANFTKNKGAIKVERIETIKSSREAH